MPPLNDPPLLDVLRHGPVLHYLRALDGTLLWLSPQARPLLHSAPETLIGRSLRDLLAPGSFNFERWNAQLTALRQEDNEAYTDIEILTDRDESRWVEIHERRLPASDSNDVAAAPRVVGCMIDIAVRRQRESQLLDAQRLENLGLLSAGIAHDLNNILAPILIAGSLLRPLAQDERQQRMVEILQTSAERGARIVRQILSFAHGNDADRGPIDPRHVLRELILVIEETFPRNIRLHDDIAHGLHLIHANPTQLHQLLLNLCVNARDAMPRGGVLTVNATNTRVTTPPPHFTVAPSRRDWICISISDTGCGIPAEQLERIWTPFYTTKEQGRGTGLGLSTVRSLAIAHGGYVEVESEPGRGTCFKVYLPGLDDEVEVEAPIDGVADIPLGRGEHILVVDDEPSVRDVIRETLGHRGYEIVLASDGVEALATLNLHTERFSLVITDVHMPHMAGDILVNVLKRLQPDLPILAISGHPDAANAWLGDEQAKPDAMLYKPFPGPRLIQIVRELLDDRDTPPAGR